MSNTVAIAAGVGAGACFAVGSVLQQRQARATRAATTVALVRALVRQPLWLAGVLAAVAAYSLQAVALAFGPLALVQPLLVAELPIALALASSLSRTRLHLREYGAAVLVAGGLAAFLVIASPGPGRDDVALTSWGWILGGAAAAVALLASLVRRVGLLARTTLLAAAAAVAFATMAPLTKTTTALFIDHGAAAALAWQPWAMAAAALTGFAFSQQAFHTGPIAVSLPVLESLQPVVGAVIGVTAFSEAIAGSWPALLGEGLAAAAAVAGIVLLDTSPRVIAAMHEPPAAGAPPAVSAGARELDLRGEESPARCPQLR